MTNPSGSSCVGISSPLQAHLVLEKSPLFRLILYWKRVGVDSKRRFRYSEILARCCACGPCAFARPVWSIPQRERLEQAIGFLDASSVASFSRSFPTWVVGAFQSSRSPIEGQFSHFSPEQNCLDVGRNGPCAGWAWTMAICVAFFGCFKTVF